MEPASSAVLSTGVFAAIRSRHRAGFVPDVLDTKVYDEVFPVSNEDPF